MQTNSQPTAVTINGGLYAYGETREEAVATFRRQIAGADHGQRSSMLRRCVLTALSPDEASEVAECIASPVLAWA